MSTVLSDKLTGTDSATVAHSLLLLGIGGLLIPTEPIGGYGTEFVTDSQCNARLMVTFPDTHTAV